MTLRQDIYNLFWRPYSRLDFDPHPLLKEGHEQECRDKTDEILKSVEKFIDNIMQIKINESHDFPERFKTMEMDTIVGILREVKEELKT